GGHRKRRDTSLRHVEILLSRARTIQSPVVGSRPPRVCNWQRVTLEVFRRLRNGILDGISIELAVKHLIGNLLSILLHTDPEVQPKCTVFNEDSRLKMYLPLDVLDWEDVEMLEGLERELTPWEKTYLDELHERRNAEECELQLVEAREPMVVNVQNNGDNGALNFLILEDKESLEEEGNDTEVVINPGESEDEDGDNVNIWLDNMLREPSSPIYRPSCVRDWSKGCGPKLKLKARKCMAKRRRKAKARKARQCCGPCAKKKRAWKMEARRRGRQRVEDGWIWRAGDCIGLEGWDPWPSHEQLRVIGDAKASTSEWRISCHDARDKVVHTQTALGARGCGVGNRSTSVGGTCGVDDLSTGVDWDALAFGGKVTESTVCAKGAHAGESLGLASLGTLDAHAGEEVGNGAGCNDDGETAGVRSIRGSGEDARELGSECGARARRASEATRAKTYTV
ncbi:Unknown protein, partial [Striga hermonthica]